MAATAQPEPGSHRPLSHSPAKAVDHRVSGKSHRRTARTNKNAPRNRPAQDHIIEADRAVDRASPGLSPHHLHDEEEAPSTGLALTIMTGLYVFVLLLMDI
ncbi:hypothetical protein Dimus_032244 [Dionaea muscipula]